MFQHIDLEENFLQFTFFGILLKSSAVIEELGVAPKASKVSDVRNCLSAIWAIGGVTIR